MIEQEARNMILDIIGEVDYDIYKNYLPECSELEEDDIENNMEELLNIVRKYIEIK